MDLRTPCTFYQFRRLDDVAFNQLMHDKRDYLDFGEIEELFVKVRYHPIDALVVELTCLKLSLQEVNELDDDPGYDLVKRLARKCQGRVEI